VKAFAPLLGLAMLGVVGYLYFTGQLGGYGEGVPDVNPGAAVGRGADAAGQAGEHGLDWFLHTAWAPAAAVAVFGAWFAVKLWSKIGSFGRGFVIFVVGVSVAIFLAGINR
jgi:hypothetical protein